jgi:hypothetical protein
MVSLSCFQALIFEDPTVLKLGKTFCDQIIAYDLVPFNTECLGMSLAEKSYHYLDSVSWGLRNRKELQMDDPHFGIKVLFTFYIMIQ